MTFKIGDKIRPIAAEKEMICNHWDHWWKDEQGPSIDGSFYVVNSNDVNLTYSATKNGEGPIGRFKDFELVTETPQPSFVKLIPEQVIPARREIVGGSIAISGSAFIGVSPIGQNVMITIDEYAFNHASLREVIAHFTTIADILEENAK